MTLKHSFEQSTREMIDLGGPEFVQIRYTDLLGRFLAKYTVNDSLNELWNGVGLDGSSVRGFTKIDESDLLLVPDKSTLRPAATSNYKVASVIADVYEGLGRGRFIRDPRNVSQLMEKHLASEGLSCQIGPEVECFIFDDLVFDENSPKILSTERTGKYPIRRKDGYDAPPFQDSLVELRLEVAEILKNNFLFRITNLNHEVASSGQIEINFMHSTLTSASDNVQIYKDTVRSVAKRHNKVANFMPKPIFDESDPRSGEGDNGSGMHVSLSLWTGERNIFFDMDDDYAELSQTGRYFIGGVLEHASSLSALVAPTVNSYHRLMPGFEAPAYIAWSRANRSAVVRVPVNDKNNFKSKRIEFRAPDPSANPYLAFSATFAAGLDGITKKIDPGNPVKEDIFKMSDYTRSSLNIKSLPSSLDNSLKSLMSDHDYLKPCFHGNLLETYVSLKEEEISHVGKSKERQFMRYYDI